MWASDPPKRILYFYGIWSPLYQELQKKLDHITFIEGLPTLDQVMTFTDPNTHTAIILDDVMNIAKDSEVVELLYTRISHHRSCTVMLVLQNLYNQGRKMKAIQLNTKYIVIFRSPRDVMQLRILGMQLYPSRPSAVVEAYTDAIKEHQFAHLVIDMTAQCEDEIRIRSQVLVGQETNCYVPI